MLAASWARQSGKHLFPGTIYLFILYTPDPAALPENSQGSQSPAIRGNLYRALHCSSCKDHNAEALGGTAPGDWCINLPLLNINSCFLLSLLLLCQTPGVFQGADLKYFALIPIFTQWDGFKIQLSLILSWQTLLKVLFTNKLRTCNLLKRAWAEICFFKEKQITQFKEKHPRIELWWSLWVSHLRIINVSLIYDCESSVLLWSETLAGLWGRECRDTKLLLRKTVANILFLMNWINLQH